MSPCPAEVRGHCAELVAAMLAGIGRRGRWFGPAYLDTVSAIELDSLRHEIDAAVAPIDQTGVVVSKSNANGSQTSVSGP